MPGKPGVETAVAHIERERSLFRTLLLSNPNYFTPSRRSPARIIPMVPG